MKKGTKHSDKTKAKMRKSSTHHWKGKNKSEATKEKISESKMGSIPWNKGKKGLQKAWNKGLKGYQISWKKGTANGPKGYGRKYITVDGKQWRMSHYVYCKENNLEAIPKGYCIHHIDGNHANNEIKNLRFMGHGEHSSLENQISKQKIRDSR